MAKIENNRSYVLLSEDQEQKVNYSAGVIRDFVRQLRNSGKLSDNACTKLLNNVYTIMQQMDKCPRLKFSDFKNER